MMLATPRSCARLLITLYSLNSSLSTKTLSTKIPAMKTPSQDSKPTINRRAFAKTAALAAAGLTAATLPLAAAGSADNPKFRIQNPKSPAPNILFIAIDDLRDWANYLGYKQAKTPNLDRLAAMGVAFTNGNRLRPIYYAPTEEYPNPVTFAFTTVNERQAAEWAKLILQLRSSGVDDVSIVWLMQDDSAMTDDEIDFLNANAELIHEMGEGLGWIA